MQGLDGLGFSKSLCLDVSPRFFCILSLCNSVHHGLTFIHFPPDSTRSYLAWRGAPSKEVPVSKIARQPGEHEKEADILLKRLD